MKFLIDTNIFIKAEPTAHDELEPESQEVAELLRLVQESKNQVFIHPESLSDINRDKNEIRRTARRLLFAKYPCLPASPKASDDLVAAIGQPAIGTNDYVDLKLLAALESSAVHYLVTQDRGLIKWAVKTGFDKSTLTITETLELLRQLFDHTPKPPPAVTPLKAFELNDSDAIFYSLRFDYEGFDAWLDKCKTEHRQAWVVADDGEPYSALAIVKDESEAEAGLKRKILKVCTFKVAETSQGNKYGELLLKTLFGYCVENSYDQAYLTVFPKYSALISLLQDFGFAENGMKADTGELILVKRFKYTEDEYKATGLLDFNVRFGPHALKCDGASCFIVPIKPYFADLLFPELAEQTELFASNSPYGNSIKKAYLCKSPTQYLDQGSIVLFYRSGDKKALVCIGVVEDTLKTTDPEAVAGFVGKRTVYSFNEIRSMCPSGTLAILFRQARNLVPSVSLSRLREEGVLKGAPQSITRLSDERKECLKRIVAI